jgi:hypothetical protein
MGKCSLSPYDNRTEETRNKITEGRISWYTNRIYKNSTYNWYWFTNQKGYYHILKTCKINYNGQFSHYEIEDILLKADNMTSSKTYGHYKTREECIQAIEKDMIKEDKAEEVNTTIKVEAIEYKKYITVYAGFIGEKDFIIGIYNDIKCGMEYDLISNYDFTEEEQEQLANNILDEKYKNNSMVAV